MEFPTKLIAFRCPVELIRKVDMIARAMNTTRTGVIIEAVRLFARQVHARGGRVIPPYEGVSLLYTLHFEPDGRGMSTQRKAWEKRQALVEKGECLQEDEGE